MGGLRMIDDIACLRVLEVSVGSCRVLSGGLMRSLLRTKFEVCRSWLIRRLCLCAPHRYLCLHLDKFVHCLNILSDSDHAWFIHPTCIYIFV